MNIYFPFPCEYSDFSLAESFYSIFLHSKSSEILPECVLVWIFSHLFYLALSRLHLIKEFVSLAQKKTYSIIISFVSIIKILDLLQLYLLSFYISLILAIFLH